MYARSEITHKPLNIVNCTGLFRYVFVIDMTPRSKLSANPCPLPTFQWLARDEHDKILIVPRIEDRKAGANYIDENIVCSASFFIRPNDTDIHTAKTHIGYLFMFIIA
jgi:hypothetical protein